MNTLPDPDARGTVMVDTTLLVVVDPLLLHPSSLRRMAELVSAGTAAAIRTCWDGVCTLSATPDGVLVGARPGDILTPPGMNHWQALRCMAPTTDYAVSELLSMAEHWERGQA